MTGEEGAIGLGRPVAESKTPTSSEEFPFPGEEFPGATDHDVPPKTALERPYPPALEKLMERRQLPPGMAHVQREDPRSEGVGIGSP